MKIICIVFAGLMLPWNVAVSADWQTVSQATDHVRMIDLETVTRSKGYVKAWTMTTYWSEQTTRGYPIVKYRSVKELSYFDCGGRMAFTAQAVYYEREAGEGEVRHSVINSVAASKFSEVVPDSVGEANLRTACALTKAVKRMR